MQNALPEHFENLKHCRSCGEWLEPMCGAMKRPAMGTIFSLRNARLLADQLAENDSQHYFECFDCEKKRKRKEFVLYGIGIAIFIYAVVADYLEGKLSLPW